MLELTCDTTVDLPRSALRHGAGLFETVRLREGHAWRLELHLERLAAGCAFLGLEAPPDAASVLDFLAAHGIGAGLAFGALRLIAADGLLRVFAEALPAPDRAAVSLGRSLETVRFSIDPLHRFKTLSYLENLRLGQEASERGLFEVVALNERGLLTDGGRTNLFAVLGGQVYTPPVAEGALPGIARRVLLEAGLASETTLRWEDLEGAEALFLANALRGALPVERLEGSARDASHPAILRAITCLEEE